MRNEAASAGHLLSKHDQLIAGFLADFPAARTTGFMQALAALPDAPYTQDLIANDREWRRDVSIVPDAFVIDEAARTIAVYEAVVTSDLTAEKMAKIEEIGWAIDQDGYTIGVVRGSEYGRSLLDPIEDGIARLGLCSSASAQESAQ